MANWRTPSILVAAIATILVTTAAAQTPSSKPKTHHCTQATLKGHWVVITDVLHSQEGMIEGATVGTMNLPGNGTLNGVYDREGADGFHPNISYSGTVWVNPDCTGTMSWADTGSSLTLKASINVADDGEEMHGVFQDPSLIVGSFRLKRTGVHECSIKTIATSYASTSDLLYQLSGTIDGYALGTIQIHKDGSTNQTFDLANPSGFQPGVQAVGTVMVRPNCTGTASFHVVGDTQMIGQSFVVADRGREIWSMFQDPTIEVGTSRGVRIWDPKEHRDEH